MTGLIGLHFKVRCDNDTEKKEQHHFRVKGKCPGILIKRAMLNFQLKYHIQNYNYRYYLSRRVIYCDADQATHSNKAQRLPSHHKLTEVYY